MELKSCSGQWDFQIGIVFSVPLEGNYPGEDYFDNQAVENCDSDEALYIEPSTESWEAGDRSVICIVANESSGSS